MSFNYSNSENICTLNTHNLSPPLSLSLSSDDFFVDQLLNLNNDDHHHLEDDSFLVTPTPVINKLSPFHSPHFDFDPDQHDFVLSVPPAEEADLEWLSHFVEESFSQFSSPYPDVIGPNREHPKFKPKPEPEPESPKVTSFTPPPGLNKSRRSKRVWTGARVSTPALAESSSSSSSDPSSPDSARRQKRREVGPGSGSPRRCTHCGVQKTPQWRCGPLGPKSLCNACGVRYNSGRLLPEYRPACSPTFSSELHSNNHRKVLEMRRKKERRISGRVEPGLSHPVSSFG